MSVEVVVSDFTEIEAHQWLKEVNVAIADLVAAVAEGYMRRAWIPLGYASWAALCESDEFKFPRLSVEQRRSSVMALRDAGLSHRAIASAVGTSDGTVRNDLSTAQNYAVDEDKRITGLDGRSRPATRTETHDDETWQFRDTDNGEECIVESDPDLTPQPEAPPVEPVEPPITKPDLGDGISHPARFSDAILDRFDRHLDHIADAHGGGLRVLDPFAGTGRIHELDYDTTGVELEAEWARLHPDTICASALDLPFDDETFDAICTSPAYGNRLADHHQAADPERRRSYTHDLGRPLTDGNSGAMHWGEAYRRFHIAAWGEAWRVLRPGGLLLLNIKDHVRDGIQQPVSAWHVAALTDAGFWFDPARSAGVATRHLRQGETSERAGQELVLAFTKDAL